MRVEHGQPILPRSLTSEERGLATEAMHAARAGLYAAQPIEIAKEVARLLAAFPLRDAMDPIAEKSRHHSYFDVLRGKPHKAITRSVDRFIRGEIGAHNPAFAPTPAELSRVVVEEIGSDNRELIGLQNLLAAKTFDEMKEPEPSQLVVDGMEDLRRELHAGAEQRIAEGRQAGLALIDDASQRLLERERAQHPGTPTGISPALHRMLEASGLTKISNGSL
jgi:hypothetical protein